MHNPIADIIAEKGWCVADGATGSNFFGRGLEAGYPPDLRCVEKPEEVLWLHGAFLEAGADIILTNSFGANAPRLTLHHAENRVAELSLAAAQLASEATRQHFEDTGRQTCLGHANRDPPRALRQVAVPTNLALLEKSPLTLSWIHMPQIHFS